MSANDSDTTKSEDIPEKLSSNTDKSDQKLNVIRKIPFDLKRLKHNKQRSLKDMGFSVQNKGWESDKFPPKTDLYKSICDWLKQPESNDVTIDIDGFIYKCNKMVLWTYCKYFRKNPDIISLEIPNSFMTPMEFRTLYNWMLEDQPKICHDNILSLLTASIAFGVKDLQKQCWSLLGNSDIYDEDNAFFMFLKARIYGLPHVRRLMLSRIKRFFLPFVSSKEFVCLNIKNLLYLMKGNHFSVNSEIEVFYSLIRWLNYDWDERGKYISQLLRLVRFSLLSCADLLQLKHDFKSGEVNRVTRNSEFQDKIQLHLEVAVCRKSNTVYAMGMNTSKFPRRHWIYDSNCEYHHRTSCDHNKEVTYKMFLKYLRLLQCSGSICWRNFVSAEDNNINCCNLCNKSSEKLSIPIDPKTSTTSLSGKTLSTPSGCTT